MTQENDVRHNRMMYVVVEPRSYRAPSKRRRQVLDLAVDIQLYLCNDA